MPVLEFLRQYTLREYTAVLAVALMGGAGLVFMLNAAGTGSSGGETLALKGEAARSTPAGSVRSVEAEALAAQRRAKDRARILAERRRIRAMRAERAAHRAAVAARARARSARAARAKAPRRTVVRSAPRPAASAPIRVVTRAPTPAPRPKPAPVSTPAPKKSGSSGGGSGGSFDDSG